MMMHPTQNAGITMIKFKNIREYFLSTCPVSFLRHAGDFILVDFKNNRIRDLRIGNKGINCAGNKELKNGIRELRMSAGNKGFKNGEQGI